MMSGVIVSNKTDKVMPKKQTNIGIAVKYKSSSNGRVRRHSRNSGLAIQVTTAVMMVLRDADVAPQSPVTASTREPQRQRHGRPAQEKTSFNWNVQDRYRELLNSEMQFTNILETKALELDNEEKVPVIKPG